MAKEHTAFAESDFDVFSYQALPKFIIDGFFCISISALRKNSTGREGIHRGMGDDELVRYSPGVRRWSRAFTWNGRWQYSFLRSIMAGIYREDGSVRLSGCRAGKDGLRLKMRYQF
jgi:hypothetical protein